MSRHDLLRHYLPFLLTRADTLLSRPFMNEVERRGFSVAEWRILATLYDADRLTVGEIAELVLLPQPTVSRWIDRLERQSFITRAAVDADRRRTIVRLTPAGRSAAKRLITAAADQLAKVEARLPARDVAELERILRSVIAEFERDP